MWQVRRRVGSSSPPVADVREGEADRHEQQRRASGILAYHSTGSGKTVVAALILMAYYDRLRYRGSRPTQPAGTSHVGWVPRSIKRMPGSVTTR